MDCKQLLETMLSIQELHTKTDIKKQEEAQTLFEQVKKAHEEFRKISPFSRINLEYRQAAQIYRTVLSDILTRYPKWKSKIPTPYLDYNQKI